MSPRSELVILGLLALGALCARFWAVSNLEGHRAAKRTHEKHYQFILETVDDLSLRRENLSLADDQQGFSSHFSAIGVEKANTGQVTTQPNKRNAKRNFQDTVLTIKFEEEDPRFSREQLWVFLYNGENPKLIPRMRSTRFHISPAYGESVRREVPKGVDRSDLWRVREMAFTQRNPIELNG